MDGGRKMTIDGYNKNVNTSNPKSKLKTKELKERNVMIIQNEVKERMS